MHACNACASERHMKSEGASRGPHINAEEAANPYHAQKKRYGKERKRLDSGTIEYRGQVDISEIN